MQNLRYALKIFPQLLLQVNLRLRACLAKCLKFGQFQPKRSYEARAYKKSVLKYSFDIMMHDVISSLQTIHLFLSSFYHHCYILFLFHNPLFVTFSLINVVILKGSYEG